MIAQKTNQSADLSSEQELIMKIFEDAHKLYLSVLVQLKFDHNDKVYAGLLLGMIERQTKDHIIMNIWRNMNDKQAMHFHDYINQMSLIAPYVSNDDLLMEFAMLYPALMERVYDALQEFFESFIKRFNEIHES